MCALVDNAYRLVKVLQIRSRWNAEHTVRNRKPKLLQESRWPKKKKALRQMRKYSEQRNSVEGV